MTCTRLDARLAVGSFGTGCRPSPNCRHYSYTPVFMTSLVTVRWFDFLLSQKLDYAPLLQSHWHSARPPPDGLELPTMCEIYHSGQGILKERITLKRPPQVSSCYFLFSGFVWKDRRINLDDIGRSARMHNCNRRSSTRSRVPSTVLPQNVVSEYSRPFKEKSWELHTLRLTSGNKEF